MIRVGDSHRQGTAPTGLFLCEVQGRLAVLQMRRGRGRRREVRTVRGCRVAYGGGRVGESNEGATCSRGQLVVVEGGGVQMLFR